MTYMITMLHMCTRAAAAARRRRTTRAATAASGSGSGSASGAQLPDLLVFITGRGPQREEYLARIALMTLSHVAVRSLCVRCVAHVYARWCV